MRKLFQMGSTLKENNLLLKEQIFPLRVNPTLAAEKGGKSNRVISPKNIPIYLNNTCLLTLYVPETQIAKFANSVDLNEVAHHEPPHLDLHCLSSSL